MSKNKKKIPWKNFKGEPYFEIRMLGDNFCCGHISTNFDGGVYYPTFTSNSFCVDLPKTRSKEVAMKRLEKCFNKLLMKYKTQIDKWI